MGNRIWKEVADFKKALRRKGEPLTLERIHGAFVPPGHTRAEVEKWCIPLREAIRELERQISPTKRARYPVLRSYRRPTDDGRFWEMTLHPTKGWRHELSGSN